MMTKTIVVFLMVCEVAGGRPPPYLNRPMSCEVKSYTQRWSKPNMPWVDFDLLSDLEFGRGKKLVIVTPTE